MLAQNREQTPAAKLEVATNKPTDPCKHVVKALSTPAARRLEATGSLRDLVQAAFNLDEYQVVGGERWTRSEIFDAAVQSDHPASRSEMLALLKAVVMDRFHVEVRLNHSLHDVYAAVPDRGGIKMRRSTETASMDSSGSTFIRGHLTVAELCRRLQQDVGRPVVDETKTTDRYVVNLSWTDETAQSDPPASSVSTSTASTSTVSTSTVSIFTALKEQLGLQLRATKRRTEEVEIVRSERPSPN